jgi:hypothetical protein
MASVPVDVLGGQGGFVAATDLLEVPRAVAAAGAPNPAVVAPAAPAVAAQGGPRPMRWNNNTSGFVLRRMAQLLNDGSRPDKVFKNKDVNLVAKHLKEYSGEVVRPTQVYNHLRKWRQKWARISKLKDLSGALWDSDTNSIMLEAKHYLGHCKVEHLDYLSHLCPTYLTCSLSFYHLSITQSPTAGPS